MPLFIVTYTDEFGLYAQVFSTRAKAQAFIDSFVESVAEEFCMVETKVDQAEVHADLATEG